MVPEFFSGICSVGYYFHAGIEAALCGRCRCGDSTGGDCLEIL